MEQLFVELMDREDVLIKTFIRTLGVKWFKSFLLSTSLNLAHFLNFFCLKTHHCLPLQARTATNFASTNSILEFMAFVVINRFTPEMFVTTECLR